jgi:Abnormal spindle-like microcephaly-assoc'd, ASPM-SPD-2-Hydin/Immunoglobulin I-set domain/Immunoglobulin domain
VVSAVPSNGRTVSRALALFIFSTIFLLAIIQSGCTGITSAKGTSVVSAADTSNTSSSAVLSASPAAVDFGSVPVGATMNQSLTLNNSGTTAVTISQVNASGAGLTVGGVALPVTVNPGASVTFTASFAPSAAGDVTGSVSFMNQQLRQVFGLGWHGTGKAAAPLISAQPASQSILAGQTATFSVTTNGTPPLSYQWNRNGAAISGATSSTYTTPPETTSDNGAQFNVIVSNSAGSVTSTAAMLSVTTSPVGPSITSQPANQTVFAGQTATFSVAASGTAPLSYQWRKNGASIAGGTSASYTTPAETTSDNGALFSVLVSNSAGSVTSNNAAITVNPDPTAPSITSQPASQTITGGQTATFSVTASGTAPLTYQWQKNGAAITGATSPGYTTPAETTSDNGAQFAVVVSNSAGTATSNSAILTVNPAPVAPSISTQPSNQTIAAGQTATFSVTASGTVPLSYQWRKNGAAITGATLATYTTPAETTADNGAQFTVVVSNSVGNANSNAATLTVNSTPAAPSITTQPSSQTITAGQTATFSVTASGTTPLSYQWQKNGAAISGATSATYTTPAETTSDSGAQFSVVVSNSAGSATSNSAILTVNPAPVAPSITTQPSSQTITAGQTATFSVTASGTAPLTYQWRKNGTAISGATSASYTTPAETTSDNGAQFTVVVTNSAGNATSNAATLTVNAVPPGALTPDTTTLSFGNVIVSNSSALGVTFTNSGSVNITVSSVTISGAGFTSSGIGNGQIITPGQVVTSPATLPIRHRRSTSPAAAHWLTT